MNVYFSGKSMNNLLSYCGLTDSRMRASEKDLPVVVLCKMYVTRPQKPHYVFHIHIYDNALGTIPILRQKRDWVGGVKFLSVFADFQYYLS